MYILFYDYKDIEKCPLGLPTCTCDLVGYDRPCNILQGGRPCMVVYKNGDWRQVGHRDHCSNGFAHSLMSMQVHGRVLQNGCFDELIRGRHILVPSPSPFISEIV